ncbi:hypothetical protein HDU76_003286 [Blyttiomyces sp. JEL0837]|nr:hypothetical protein HDU76_003286 [Blyttiomyces sp. JEL0837]
MAPSRDTTSRAVVVSTASTSVAAPVMRLQKRYSTALLLALLWLALPGAAKKSIRQGLAMRLVQFAQWIGGPSFNPSDVPPICAKPSTTKLIAPPSPSSITPPIQPSQGPIIIPKQVRIPLSANANRHHRHDSSSSGSDVSFTGSATPIPVSSGHIRSGSRTGGSNVGSNLSAVSTSSQPTATFSAIGGSYPSPKTHSRSHTAPSSPVSKNFSSSIVGIGVPSSKSEVSSVGPYQSQSGSGGSNVSVSDGPLYEDPFSSTAGVTAADIRATLAESGSASSSAGDLYGGEDDREVVSRGRSYNGNSTASLKANNRRSQSIAYQAPPNSGAKAIRSPSIVPTSRIYTKESVSAKPTVVNDVTVEEEEEEEDYEKIKNSQSRSVSDNSTNANIKDIVTSESSSFEDDMLTADSDSNSIIQPVYTLEQLTSSHRSHRHTAAADRAMELLLSMEKLDGRWDSQGEKSGVRIHTMVVEGVALPIVRGDGVIEGGFTLQEAYGVIRNSHCRKTWDPRYDHGESLEHFNIDEALGYSVQKGTFPVAPRDLVTILFNRRVPGKLYYVAASVADPTAPTEGRGRVRGDLAVAGWILSERPGGQPGLDATYIVQIDPKGTIPSSLVKLVQTQTPLCISAVSSYLNRQGPIPFLIRDIISQPNLLTTQPQRSWGPGPDVVLMSEDHDDRLARYDLELTIRSTPPSSDGRRGLFVLAIPKPSYPFGADLSVTITPAGAAEVRARLVCSGYTNTTGFGGSNGGFVMGDGFKGVGIENEVRRLVSSGIGAVVEMWVDGEEGEVEMEVRVEPGRHGVVLNGEPVDLR